MVEHNKPSMPHSLNSSEYISSSDRFSKTRSRQKPSDTSNYSEHKNSTIHSSKDAINHNSNLRSDSISVIDFDPTLVSVDFYCNYCNQSLSVGGCRIRCAECLDYDLCISCACNHKCTEPHNLTHNYVPIGPNSFELFSEGWTADEELILLEGIGKYGFGNWKQVAEMVNKVNSKQKTPAECENHYYDVYISTGSSPHPNVKNLRTPIKCPKTRDMVYKYYEEVSKNHRRFENPDSDNIVSSEETGSHSTFIPPAVNLLHSDPTKVKFFQNFTGYNVYRDDLENEYHPDAELILKDVEFEPWDSPPEIQFKIQLIDIYNAFLDERIYRKRILMHRFWNDYITRETAMANMTELEKMLYWRLSPLIRFHTEEDHISLTKLLIAKIELEKRLEIVQQWKSLGLRTLKDIQEFDLLKNTARSSSTKHVNHFSRISGLSAKILKDGVVHKDELSEYMNEINEKFCNEFYITKSHLDDILNSFSNAQSDTDFNYENPITHIWDLHFEDFNIENNDPLPDIKRFPHPSDVPDNSNIRVILDPEKKGIDLSDMKFDDIKFGIVKHNAQQSNIQTHDQSLFYLARFYHDRINKVQKNIHKPKIELNYPAKRRLSQRRFI
ncbi:transcriptional adaptor2-related protein, putative [Theileria annulata]|uniref:Transcriptional adaptor2-related protein, putative n=1 Tax=Theileria annulata TaxID=5874 RepID=Q4UG81_THEAN|nr:transcriptional adaptor2-related protein, putative [Theileria annulata]CAI73908.1 transcriptional adaptor2-related protein, putative [Theileria annulata]|eukprot:XP_954585.1 transcriptional adaptor2-related protein, putative [Theileria annulata]